MPAYPLELCSYSEPPSDFLAYRGSDPAARAAVAGFATGPAHSLAEAYGITVRQVQLVKGYLQHLTAAYVAPAFAANVLGPPLGPHSGGLLAARTVGDWISGASCGLPSPLSPLMQGALDTHQLPFPQLSSPHSCRVYLEAPVSCIMLQAVCHVTSMLSEPALLCLMQGCDQESALLSRISA